MASSSSSSLSVPVLASQSWKYDVFLSFRGEDTRKNFVDHFYTALDRQGIHTYKDDVTLPRGESISPALLKAIDESQAAVIIFSENYANSTWCLDELLHIMKCRVERNQTVMPIFYDVEPTEVRKQKRTYKEAFDKHELENKAKDLFRSIDVSGWEPKLIANGHEAQAIKEIVEEISKRLKVVTSGSNENLIGMRTRVQGLKSKLQIEAGGVHMVGIWGLGGGGKTTLASTIYDEISSLYDGYSFVDNIREESSKVGLKKLKENMLSDIFKQQVQEGRMIMGRLRRLKVLIVLDDVDHLDQLEALAGSHDWFGEGSRILITTRDQHILNAHKVHVTHNISLLNHDEAVTLFNKHAHGGDHTPMEDFEKLSEEVVSYAGGLPLALRVLGSFLCGRNISQWRSAIDRLKDNSDKGIIGILRISYDGLEQDEKELFLDIACFFRREKKDEAMEKLHACGFHPVIGVDVLTKKALVVIDERGRFDMHDLVQEMGHHIVRGEHPRNPEKHSRVWKEEDVRRILAMDATTKLDNIEAIDFGGIVSYEELQRFLQVAGNMNKLRWIDLHCYQQRDEIALPLPENFPPQEICWLNIRGGISQKQLWEGYKHLPNLTHMHLGFLHNLIKIPDLSGLANLERFELYDCTRLEEIHPSIGRLESLVSLSICDCWSLRKFPSITRIKNLETLQFEHCWNLGIMSEEEMEMEKLGRDVVDLGNTTASGKQQVAAASSSSSCKKPARTNFFLNCWTCGSSSSPPPVVESYCLPHHYRALRFSHTALKNLNLSWCFLGDEEIGSDFLELPNLEQLNLSSNPLIPRLDFSILRLPRLKRLDVSNCRGLVELSELPSSIAAVIADGCESLESFGDISNCKWLRNVSLMGKTKLCVDTLIESMFQRNTIEDHFISVVLDQHQIPNRFVGRLFRGNTFTQQLPDDWYNDFCGFLICIVTNMEIPDINIKMMKQEDPPPFDLSQQQQEDSDDEAAVGPPTIIYGEDMKTYVGYVSFGSLIRHTTSTSFTSSYHHIISLSIKDGYSSYVKTCYVGMELIPRKSKSDDEVQITTTHSSEFFWDKQSQDANLNTFTIQQHCDSKSSIQITWQPYDIWIP